MTREIVHTAGAPKAIGPYSQAIKTEQFLFCSGQTPLEPESGVMAEGDIGELTRRVLNNLKAVVEAGGSSFSKVVKTTVFLVDMNDFAAMNAVYAEFFPENPPARSTIQVAGLPRGARVEIELIAQL
ncbi:MAG: RidA family protein [Chloroflexaceae bacterium]|nr:RidA family protein [Chloroflexaceae bacterium]